MTCRSAVLVVALALAAACGHPASAPPAAPTAASRPATPTPVAAATHTGTPTKPVVAGALQTACSNGLNDCADDEVCVVTHTGANVARCAADPCPGLLLGCGCADDPCAGMTCSDEAADRRTLECFGGLEGAP